MTNDMKISRKDRAMLGRLALLTAETALNTYAQRYESNPKHRDNRVYLVCADLNLRCAEENGIDTAGLRARLNLFERRDYRHLQGS